jgi:hypothetical protein
MSSLEVMAELQLADSVAAARENHYISGLRSQAESYAMLALASALRLYALHKIQAGRSYTPGRMMRAAARYTGETFKARDYLVAAKALRERALGAGH